MDNNFGNGNYDPNQNPLNMTGGQPMDAGMTQPVNTGFNQPMDAGMTQPVDTGMTQPVNTGFNQPMDAGMTQPVNTGFNQPMDASLTQPVGNTGFNQPMDASLTQPVGNTGFNQPMDASLTQPVGNTGFNQPMDASLTQPVGNTGFNQPMDAGMTQPVGAGMTQPVSPDMSSQFAQINQQNMQQFGGNTGFNQPMNTMTQPDGKKAKKQKGPKKPLSGGAIAGIITACVAVVALVVCGIIFLPKVFKTPKEKVKDAFEKTFTKTDNTADFSKKYIEEGGETKISASVEQIAGQDVPADFSIDVIYAPSNKLMNANVDLNVSNDSILKLNIVGTETNTYIYAPDLIDGYFMLPNDDFANKLANSELGQMMNIDASQLSNVNIDYFSAPTTVVDESSDSVDDLWDKCEVEKDGKATVSVNGKSVKAKKYIVTIPKDVLLDEIEAAAGTALDQYVSQYGMSTSDLRTSISAIIGGDIVANVYVKDNKVVKVDCKNESGMVNYELWLDYDSDEIAGEVKLSMMGEQISIKVDVKDPEGNPNGSVNVNYLGEIYDVNFDTTVIDKNDEKGADINIEAKYNAETLFKGKVSFNQNLNNKSASDIDSSVKVYDVCAMSQQDLMTAVQENMYAINEWATRVSQNPILSGIFGGFAGDIGMDDYDDLEDLDDWDDTDDYDDTDNDTDDVGDMTLVNSDGVAVKILGCFDGLECNYSSEYSVDFADDTYSFSCDYELESSYWYDTPLEVVESIYIPEDDDYSTYEIPEQEIGGSLELEGTTVYYSKLHVIETYIESGFTNEKIRYEFVREVADGVYLVADIYVYPESDKFNATAEELAQVLSSQYFSVQ